MMQSLSAAAAEAARTLGFDLESSTRVEDFALFWAGMAFIACRLLEPFEHVTFGPKPGIYYVHVPRNQAPHIVVQMALAGMVLTRERGSFVGEPREFERAFKWADRVMPGRPLFGLQEAVITIELEASIDGGASAIDVIAKRLLVERTLSYDDLNLVLDKAQDEANAS